MASIHVYINIIKYNTENILKANKLSYPLFFIYFLYMAWTFSILLCKDMPYFPKMSNTGNCYDFYT